MHGTSFTSLFQRTHICFVQCLANKSTCITLCLWLWPRFVIKLQWQKIDLISLINILRKNIGMNFVRYRPALTQNHLFRYVRTCSFKKVPAIHFVQNFKEGMFMWKCFIQTNHRFISKETFHKCVKFDEWKYCCNCSSLITHSTAIFGRVTTNNLALSISCTVEKGQNPVLRPHKSSSVTTFQNKQQQHNAVYRAGKMS